MADSGRIQLNGLIKLGPGAGSLVDYSNYIASFVLHLTRESVAVAATYGTPRVRTRAGARTDTLEINFFADEGDVGGVHNELMDGLLLSSPLVFFSAQYQLGALAPSNPGATGSFVPLEVDVGDPVGAWKTQTRTYTIEQITYPITA